jgi:hypothetical protein
MHEITQVLPAAMTPAQRRQEVAALLANGVCQTSLPSGDRTWHRPHARTGIQQVTCRMALTSLGFNFCSTPQSSGVSSATTSIPFCSAAA